VPKKLFEKSYLFRAAPLAAWWGLLLPSFAAQMSRKPMHQRSSGPTTVKSADFFCQCHKRRNFAQHQGRQRIPRPLRSAVARRAPDLSPRVRSVSASNQRMPAPAAPITKIFIQRPSWKIHLER
jgi:hypothetical protein